MYNKDMEQKYDFNSISQDVKLTLGDVNLTSRLLLGTGKFSSLDLMRSCHEIAETEMITVALRRISLNQNNKFTSTSIIDYINLNKINLLPNTAGAHSATEAFKLVEIASALGLKRIKLEVMQESKSLLPDVIETAKTVELIRKKYNSQEMFIMVYTNDDPIAASRLYNIGADCIMPGGSPIGSGRGIQNLPNMRMILDLLHKKIPIILDAGIGSPKDVIMAMELGFDAVLLNSAIAHAQNPIQMALAMKYACIAGRLSYLAGRIPQKLYANSSSPELDF